VTRVSPGYDSKGPAPDAGGHRKGCDNDHDVRSRSVFPLDFDAVIIKNLCSVRIMNYLPRRIIISDLEIYDSPSI